MKFLFNDKASRYILFLCFLGLATLYLPKLSQAQETITQNIPLSFGRFVLVDNNAVRRLTFRNNCTENAEPEYMFIIDPQCGEYTVTGYLPNRRLNITFGIATLNGPGASIFTLNNLTTRPINVRTDGAGEATFQVRGTLNSNGSGGVYLDGTYTGNFALTVTN